MSGADQSNVLGFRAGSRRTCRDAEKSARKCEVELDGWIEAAEEITDAYADLVSNVTAAFGIISDFVNEEKTAEEALAALEALGLPETVAAGFYAQIAYLVLTLGEADLFFDAFAQGVESANATVPVALDRPERFATGNVLESRMSAAWTNYATL